jgi:hypothetical protein
MTGVSIPGKRNGSKPILAVSGGMGTWSAGGPHTVAIVDQLLGKPE